MDLEGRGWEVEYWVKVAWDRDKRRAVVNTVMNSGVLYNTRTISTS
jgi:hypothetical protein